VPKANPIGIPQQGVTELITHHKVAAAPPRNLKGAGRLKRFVGRYLELAADLC
jgi:hypothetical protein